jgi:hypothetical protein
MRLSNWTQILNHGTLIISLGSKAHLHTWFALNGKAAISLALQAKLKALSVNSTADELTTFGDAVAFLLRGSNQKVLSLSFKAPGNDDWLHGKSQKRDALDPFCISPTIKQISGGLEFQCFIITRNRSVESLKIEISSHKKSCQIARFDFLIIAAPETFSWGLVP